MKKVDESMNQKGRICFFRGKYDFLSNFKECRIIDFEGNEFTSAEAMFQSYKTIDPEERKKFTKMNPKQAKAAGRKVQLREDWEDIKFDIMWYVVYQKFTQNDDLCKLLIKTGNADLIEGNNWHDSYWGMCFKKVPCKDGDYEILHGENRLGLILRQIRDVMLDKNIPTYWHSEYDDGDDAHEGYYHMRRRRDRRNSAPAITYTIENRPCYEFLSIKNELIELMQKRQKLEFDSADLRLAIVHAEQLTREKAADMADKIQF